MEPLTLSGNGFECPVGWLCLDPAQKAALQDLALQNATFWGIVCLIIGVGLGIFVGYHIKRQGLI